MAVEKMSLVNIIGRLDNMDDFLQELIEIDEIDQVNALTGIQNRDFGVEASEENTNRIEDLNDVRSFPKVENDYIRKLESIQENLQTKSDSKKERLDYEEIDKLYDSVDELIEKKKNLLEKKKKLKEYINNYQILRNDDIDIEKILKLKYFNYRFGEVSKEGRYILKNNYDIIPSAIIHIKNDGNTNKEYNEYINEIISIDDATSDLREKTDKIIEDEKENVSQVSIDLDKHFDNLTKEKSTEIYNSIISKADKKSKEIENDFEEKSSNIKIIFDKHKDELVNDFVEKIKNE